MDGGSDLDAALAALWSDVPVQRCSAHEHRDLLAHAPEPPHEELSNHHKYMMHAEPAKVVENRGSVGQRSWGAIAIVFELLGQLDLIQHSFNAPLRRILQGRRRRAARIDAGSIASRPSRRRKLNKRLASNP